MGFGYNDIYVLAPERSASAAFRFLEACVPSREPARNEFPFPEGTKTPGASFHDAGDAIRYCEACPSEAQRFYFRNTAGGEPAHAMLFFTRDGAMIVGVSICAQQEDRHRQAADITNWLTRLRDVTGAQIGYALYECPPPCDTEKEFVNGLAETLPPKLVDGTLVQPGPDEPLARVV